MDGGDQAVLVAADIEHRELFHLIDRPERSLDFGKRRELRLRHQRVPHAKRLCCLPVLRREIAQPFSCYDVHTLVYIAYCDIAIANTPPLSGLSQAY